MANTITGPMCQIVANAPYAVALLDEELCYITASGQWMNHFNLQGEILGKSHLELFPVIGEHWKAIYELALRGKGSKSEADFTTCFNGEIKWLKWEVQCLFDEQGKVCALVLYYEIIEDPKDANMMLKRKLNLYEATNLAAKIGSWEFDFVQSELYWSPVTRQIHGVADDYEPDLHTAINFFKEGDSRNKIIQYFGAAFTTGAAYEADLILVTAQGVETWVRVHGKAEFDQGICVRVYGTFQSIQHQKLQEIKLANSEIKYRSVIENSHYAFLLTIPDVAVLDANEAAVQMFGYSIEELRQLPRYALLDEQDPRVTEFLKLRQDCGKAVGELTCIRKNGQRFPCQLSSAVFKDAEGNEINSVVIVDITKIKEAENALAVNEEKYRKIFENIQDIYYRTDQNGIVTEISPSVNRYYNYHRDEIIGTPALAFYCYNDDLERIMKALKRDREVTDFELKLKTKYSQLVYASVNARLIIEDGVVIGAEGSIRDITFRKAQENEMSALNTELRALNTHREKLLSVIGHDLRSPVAASLKLAELALMDREDISKEELIEYLSKMEVGLQNANELLENLLHWANNQFNSLNFNPVLIHDLRHLVLSCVKRIRPMADAKGIVLSTNVPDALMIYADKDMLDAVIRNLVSNAIKFTTGGTILVNVEVRDYDILYTVSDSGTGMSEEKMAHLFNKSFNQPSYGTAGEKGTGLGLELCRDFVEKHQGKIWVESQIGQGSTFYFTTPV